MAFLFITRFVTYFLFVSDLAPVVGANDSVNTAAQGDCSSIITSRSILELWKGKKVREPNEVRLVMIC